MNEIINHISNSNFNLIGIIVVVSLTLILTSFLQEVGKYLWRKYDSSRIERRFADSEKYDGIERRYENIAMKKAITDLIHSLANEKKVFSEFIDTWKESHHKMEDSLEEIKRKQNNNWKQLFEEELPKILNK